MSGRSEADAAAECGWSRQKCSIQWICAGDVVSSGRVNGEAGTMYVPAGGYHLQELQELAEIEVLKSRLDVPVGVLPEVEERQDGSNKASV